MKIVRRRTSGIDQAPRESLKNRNLRFTITLLGVLLTASYASLQWLGRDFMIAALTATSLAILCLTGLLVVDTAKLLSAGGRRRREMLLPCLTSVAAVVFAASLVYFVPLLGRSASFGIRAIAKQAGDAKIQVMTTLVVDHTHEMSGSSELRHLSKAVRADWGVDDGTIGNESFLQRTLGPHMQSFQERVAAELHRAGVPLLLGTDAFGFPGVPPGISVHEELELLQKAGLSRYDALRTATVNPAAFVNQSNAFGQIVPGRRADLLVAEGNPLDDLRTLRSIRGVTIRGRWLSSSELGRMVDSLPE